MAQQRTPEAAADGVCVMEDDATGKGSPTTPVAVAVAQRSCPAVSAVHGGRDGQCPAEVVAEPQLIASGGVQAAVGEVDPRVLHCVAHRDHQPGRRDDDRGGHQGELSVSRRHESVDEAVATQARFSPLSSLGGRLVRAEPPTRSMRASHRTAGALESSCGRKNHGQETPGPAR